MLPNAAHLHLLLNHLPVLGVPFALLLLAGGMLACSEPVRRAGLIACVAAGALAGPAFWSGEPAEHAIEGIPGIAEARIEEHEEAAEWALGGAVALGAIALGALVLSLRRGAAPVWATTATLVVGLVVAAMLARAAFEGGRIRHPEIGARDAGPGVVASNRER